MKFDVNSKFWQMANLLSDVVLVNILFILLCLPLITIGPALASLFYSANALHDQEYPALFKLFRDELQRNFRKKCALWISYSLFIGALAAVSLFWFQLQSFVGTLLFVIFVLILMVTVVSLFIALAMSTHYASSFNKLIKNSYLVMIVAPGPSMALLLTILICPILIYFQPQILYPMVFIGFVVIAYVMNFFFRLLFKKIR